MTDYKLAPIPPTPEMVEAAEDAYMPFGDMDLEIRMAVLAAPAVQGEPVAWLVTKGRMFKDRAFMSERGAKESALERKDGAIVQPLYTAPQPAEQQPDAGDSLTSVPDEVFATEFAAWWDEHGQFCRAGGGTYERTFAFEAWRHLYPQLRNLQMAAEDQQSDVEALVEALELALEYWRHRQQRYKNRRPKWVITAEDALAELERRNQQTGGGA